MEGALLIDGYDVYTLFGVIIAKQGYNGLVSTAPLKAFDTNDWPDEDGIEPDLSEPALDSREFSILFHGGDMSKMLEYINRAVYHTYEFTEIGLTRRLRLVSNDNYSDLRGLSTFSLRFADDFPLDGYLYSPPNKSAITGYSIDKIDLGNYGIHVLDATSIKKAPPIKKNLVVSLSKKPGINYDGYAVYRGSYDVSIKCFIHSSVNDFWLNYNALLYNLTQPDTKIFRGDGLAFDCYYKDFTVTDVVSTNIGIWCEFDLNLVFTMRELYIVKLLATELGQAIMTEDNKIIKLN